MQALENAEQFVFVLHVEADTVVGNADDHLPVYQLLTDLDDGAVAGSGELESVGQQVLKNLLDQDGIALRRRQLRYLPGHGSAFSFRLQQGYNVLDQEIQPRGLEMESVTAAPRQIQQLIHQQPHAVNAIFDSFQVILGFRGHSGTEILGQDFGETT